MASVSSVNVLLFFETSYKQGMFVINIFVLCLSKQSFTAHSLFILLCIVHCKHAIIIIVSTQTPKLIMITCIVGYFESE